MKNNILVNFLSERGNRLRKWLSGDSEWEELDEAIKNSYALNPFFSPYMQRRALDAAASEFMKEEVLLRWFDFYNIEHDTLVPDERSPRCGVVAAGNIPAVALHDILSVYAAGWMPVVKLSSKDSFLIPAVFPEAVYIKGVGELYGSVEALLAMGSDNAARSLKKLFEKLPKIIRGSRYSIGVLSGSESEEDLKKLAEDMLLYYGLGCRNVSVLLVPYGYDFSKLSVYIENFSKSHLEKIYFDNLRRNRAISILSGDNFIDGGAILYKNMCSNGEESLFEFPEKCDLPPIASVWYVTYRETEQIDKFISLNRNRIQKIFHKFGLAQRPALQDYPDDTDTVRFLKELKNI